MRFRLWRLRFRRKFRVRQRQVEDFGSQAEQQLEQHFFKRFDRLLPVRRFVIGWVLLVLLLMGGVVVQTIGLSNYYQTLRPVPGGIYSEGVLGTFSNANPLYATNDADASVSRLIFASLFTYDDHNRLVGDLARDYSVDARGTTYTVHLKPNLKWHDGQPLTSQDVLYTYQMIQNPDAQSPLQASWQGIDVTAPDAHTVVFKLPDPLSSFPYNMTNGIVPRHLLATVPAASLRSADFNTAHPVGSGPFRFQAIQVIGSDPRTAEEQIALTPFEGYAGGQPKLHELIMHIYADKTKLTSAYNSGRLTAAEGLTAEPTGKTGGASQAHNLHLSAATMVFFKTSTGVLADKQVRQALVQAADTQRVIGNLGYPARAVREPLLMGQLGYDKTYEQSGLDLSAARKLLDSDGWVTGKDGIRSKAGQPLQFTLTASDTPEYRAVTHELQQDWRKAGVNLQVQLLGAADFQGALAYHNYDAVLYGISIGVDPDVFVYWDSSQADIRSANRLNLSEWKNATADASLESGRTRQSPALRVIKYKPFLQAWQQDAPALGLYQPRLLYLTNGPVAGLTEHSINTAADRFNTVQDWEIREAKVTN